MTEDQDDSCSQGLRACVQRLGIDRFDRHILICADQTVPKCCDRETSLVAGNYLKKRLQELGLNQPNVDRATCIFRTKANCLQVCSFDPDRGSLSRRSVVLRCYATHDRENYSGTSDRLWGGSRMRFFNSSFAAAWSGGMRHLNVCSAVKKHRVIGKVLSLRLWSWERDRTCNRSNNCMLPPVSGCLACPLSFLGGASKKFDRSYRRNFTQSFSVEDIQQFAKLH